MKSRLPTIIVGPLFNVVVLSSWSVLVAENPTKDVSSGMSLRYYKAESKDNATQIYSREIAPVDDVVYIETTFLMGPANPIRVVGDMPE